MSDSTPVRLGVMFSGGASSLKFLCEHDPNYGRQYEFRAAFSSVSAVSGVTFATERGIATVVHDYRMWCKARGHRFNDEEARKVYHQGILEFMQRQQVEAILLSGYMLVITDPLLSAYEGRLLNVHPALLSLRNKRGKRLLTGRNVVARAMKAGLPTGSTVHMVTKEADMGRILAEVKLSYMPHDDPVAHQEKMKMACDGPAYAQALAKLMAHGWPRNGHW